MQRILELKIKFLSCLPLRIERVAKPLSTKYEKIAHVNSSKPKLTNKQYDSRNKKTTIHISRYTLDDNDQMFLCSGVVPADCDRMAQPPLIFKSLVVFTQNVLHLKYC
jgi:hypothetical protein